MSTARRILIIGGCALGLARLLASHGVDVTTEEEYREESRNARRTYVGVGLPDIFTHLDHAVIRPSLIAGLVLDYEPPVEVERRWHADHWLELLRSSLKKETTPHVRGTWTGIEAFSSIITEPEANG